jgi:NADPH:quinone reductase-like Zn-dependent oxidoreductase
MTTTEQATMTAFIVETYCKDGVRAARVPWPTVGERDVLVKASAASINQLSCR